MVRKVQDVCTKEILMIWFEVVPHRAVDEVKALTPSCFINVSCYHVRLKQFMGFNVYICVMVALEWLNDLISLVVLV